MLVCRGFRRFSASGLPRLLTGLFQVRVLVGELPSFTLRESQPDATPCTNRELRPVVFPVSGLVQTGQFQGNTLGRMIGGLSSA